MPVGGVEHRLYVEEFIGYLGDEELTEDYDADDCPEALAHLQLEYAFAGLEAAGIEHIPEMSPDEYREQQSGLVGSHRVLGTNDGMEHLRD